MAKLRKNYSLKLKTMKGGEVKFSGLFFINSFRKIRVLSFLLFVSTTGVCIGGTLLNLCNEFPNVEDDLFSEGPLKENQNPENPTSELTRQMSTALDASGKRVFTAYATKLNAMHGVTVLDRNGNAVPLAANVAEGTLYHQFDKPLIFIKRPGSNSQYFLFTQVSDDASDFLYRHTLDASLPGNGSLEEPLGAITELNYLVYTNNNDLRYGVSVQAMQNAGSSNTTWMYFLRSSDTQVQLTARVLNSSGSFGGSINEAPVNGKAIGKIKFSPDGKQLLFAYLQPFVLGQVQFAMLRRYGLGPNGELALLEEKSLPNNLLEFEFSPDGKFIYYGLIISVTPPAGLSKLPARPGKKFRIRRWDLASQADELIGDSYNDEIFNGEHLALQRSANGKIYISAGGHRRMMVINDPGSVTVPALSGEVIADNDPSNAPYLSGAFATIAFDHHFHTIPGNGTFYATRNKREYELKDHLQNVNVVFSDMRAADGSAIVVSANNYYPYGMIMPGRNYNSADYRYGFNGMEKDDEIKSSGNSYDFGARLYDSRIGRWLTRDPLAYKFAGWSDYNAFLDNPIRYVDPDGREPKKYRIVYIVYQIDLEWESAVNIAVVDGDDWQDRAKKIFDQTFTSSGKVRIVNDGAISIQQMTGSWNEIASVGTLPFLAEPEVYRDYEVQEKKERLAHKRRSEAGRLRSPVRHGKWPGGKAINTVSTMVEITDGEITPEDAKNAAATAVLMKMSVPVDMALSIKPDNQELLDAVGHATHWFDRQYPGCSKSLWEILSSWDSSMSDACQEKWKAGGYDSWHNPPTNWAMESIKQVEEIVKQGRQE
jgi:RHS repeat-associated protein